MRMIPSLDINSDKVKQINFFNHINIISFSFHLQKSVYFLHHVMSILVLIMMYEYETCIFNNFILIRFCNIKEQG